MPNPETHPVQVPRHNRTGTGRAPQCVTRRAYEAYCKLFSPQPAMMIGDCRGGFGLGELIAFLYARSFPEDEWPARFAEAMDGLDFQE